MPIHACAFRAKLRYGLQPVAGRFRVQGGLGSRICAAVQSESDSAKTEAEGLQLRHGLQPVAGRFRVQSESDKSAKTEAEGLQLRHGLQPVAGRFRVQSESDKSAKTEAEGLQLRHGLQPVAGRFRVQSESWISRQRLKPKWHQLSEVSLPLDPVRVSASGDVLI